MTASLWPFPVSCWRLLHASPYFVFFVFFTCFRFHCLFLFSPYQLLSFLCPLFFPALSFFIFCFVFLVFNLFFNPLLTSFLFFCFLHSVLPPCMSSFTSLSPFSILSFPSLLPTSIPFCLLSGSFSLLIYLSFCLLFFLYSGLGSLILLPLCLFPSILSPRLLSPSQYLRLLLLFLPYLFATLPPSFLYSPSLHSSLPIHLPHPLAHA